MLTYYKELWGTMLKLLIPRARGEGGAKYFPRESKSFSSTSQTAAGSFCRSSEMQRMRKRKEERQKQLFYFLDLLWH